jgi:putative MATE family efflux protein
VDHRSLSMTTQAAAPSPSVIALTDQPTWKQVLILGWPALVQQLLIFIVMLYDGWLAGHLGMVKAQSAQTTALYLSWFLGNCGLLVSVGSTALVARFVGAGDRQGAIHAANQSIVLGAFLGLCGSALGFLCLEPLVNALQLEGDTAAYARDYLRPTFAALTFQMISSAGIASLIGAGDTRMGLWVLGGIAVLNLPLANMFREGWGPFPALGFVGISIGTATSNVIGGVAVLIVLAHGRAGLRLHPHQLLPDIPLMRRLLRVSIPAGFDSILTATGQLFFLSVVNRLSPDESGAHGIALRWEALGFLAGTAFGTAAMALVGQNLGAGNPDRAASSAWSAFKLCCLVMCIAGLIFVVCAPWMFALFCPDEGQQNVIREGVPVLRMIAIAMPPLAATIVFTAALRGAGDTRVPVLFTLTGFFLIRLPLAKLLTSDAVGLGLKGAWLAMIVDVFARGIFVLLRFRSGRWRCIEV